MAFISIIEYTQSEGNLRKIYDDLIAKRGKLAEVHKIQSLNPESILRHMDLYQTLMFGKSPLRRGQREMIAVVVSVANNCEYCQTHHTQALNQYWRNENKIAQLKRDFSKAELPPIEKLLCELAWQLTRIPSVSPEPIIENLKRNGLIDRAILDATMIIAYFNFVNRIVLGLGVHIEEDQGVGYKN